MKKGLVILMTVAMMALMVGAGFAAVFSDTETATGNSFTAGSLDLQINGMDDPLVETITVTNMKPGDVITKSWKVENVGSLPGVMEVKIDNIQSDDMGCTEPETEAEIGELGAATCGAGEGELGYFMETYVYKSPAHNIHQSASHAIGSAYHLGLPDGSFYGGIYRLEGKWLKASTPHVIPANDYTWVKLKIELDSDITRHTLGWPGVPDRDVDDNLVQTDQVTFDVIFKLTQE